MSGFEEYEEYGNGKWSWEIQQKQKVQIAELKSQLNNMEQCYIQKKKECEGLQWRLDSASKLVDGSYTPNTQSK